MTALCWTLIFILCICSLCYFVCDSLYSFFPNHKNFDCEYSNFDF